MQEAKNCYIEYGNDWQAKNIPTHIRKQRIPKAVHIVRHLHDFHRQKQGIRFVVEQIGNHPYIHQQIDKNRPPITFGDKNKRPQKENRNYLSSPKAKELSGIRPKR